MRLLEQKSFLGDGSFATDRDFTEVISTYARRTVLYCVSTERLNQHSRAQSSPRSATSSPLPKQTIKANEM